LADLLVTFWAHGVPAGTLRFSTKRAPGAASLQGRLSVPTQQLCRQYWTTVTLKTLATGGFPL
jgi:hypothetical protein